MDLSWTIDGLKPFFWTGISCDSVIVEDLASPCVAPDFL